MLSHLNYRERWAWVGGLFDGEGNVSLYCRPDGKLYQSNIQVSMTSLETPQEFQGIVGGRVYGPYNYAGKHTREFWRWDCPIRDQAVFLMRISPYLVEKHKRAQLLLKARQLIEEHKIAHKHTISHRRGTSVPYPEELASIKEELRRLNRRGV